MTIKVFVADTPQEAAALVSLLGVRSGAGTVVYTGKKRGRPLGYSPKRAAQVVGRGRPAKKAGGGSTPAAP